MERAHYIQERSLPELKDFLEKNIFSRNEVRQIVKRRAAFEAALIRRVARKSDFLKYIAYEMGLEALRRKRVKRLNLSSGPPSISDYALVRKQFFIFERAVSKFKSDIGLWVQYIQLAKKEGAKGLAGRICARALQLHPTAPALFIIASAHELDQFSPSSARALLQRGLRLNAESVELWTEYVKMELTYVETLRRRWAVLGIEGAAKGKGKSADENSTLPDDESEESRRLVMEGAVVLAVMENAVKALPKLELFASLQTLLTSFPVPPSLRTSLLDALHGHLARTMPHSAAAKFLHSTRVLSAELSGDALVDALKAANEDIVRALKTASAAPNDEAMRQELAELYASWVLQWAEKVEEENLREYLVLSIQSLTSKLPTRILSPSLLTTVLCHTSVSTASSSSPSSQKSLKLSRRYTTERKFHPAGVDARVWIARLNVEQAVLSGTPVENRKAVRDVWSEARGKCQGTDADVTEVWLWGVPIPSGDNAEAESDVSQGLSGEELDELRTLFDELLTTSQAHPSPTLHDAVLLRYLAVIHPRVAASKVHRGVVTYPRRDDLAELLARGKARPSANFWPSAFDIEACLLTADDDDVLATDEAGASDVTAKLDRTNEENGVRAVVDMIYTRWRDATSETVRSRGQASSSSGRGEAEAGLKYAEWLLCVIGNGTMASKVVRSALAACAGLEAAALRDEVERRWSEVLSAQESAAEVAIREVTVEDTEMDLE